LVSELSKNSWAVGTDRGISSYHSLKAYCDYVLSTIEWSRYSVRHRLGESTEHNCSWFIAAYAVCLANILPEQRTGNTVFVSRIPPAFCLRITSHHLNRYAKRPPLRTNIASPSM